MYFDDGCSRLKDETLKKMKEGEEVPPDGPGEMVQEDLPGIQ